MTSKSNLVKFIGILILISLFGAACGQATPEEYGDIVIGPEEFESGQGADATQPPTRTASPAPTGTPTLEPAITPSPTSTIPPFELHLSKAQEYIDYLEFDLAIEELNQAITIDPNSPEGYLQRGMVYLDLGKYDEAIADFTQVITLDDSIARAYSNLGIAQAQKENFDQAFIE